MEEEDEETNSKQKKEEFTERASHMMRRLMKYMLEIDLIRADQDGYVNIETLVHDMDRKYGILIPLESAKEIAATQHKCFSTKQSGNVILLKNKHPEQIETEQQDDKET